MMLKFLLALAATLAALQTPVPQGNSNSGATGWQSAKGGTLCTTTRLPNGRSTYRCEKR